MEKVRKKRVVVLKPIDYLINTKFSRLIILKDMGVINYDRKVLTKCDCGKEKVIRLADIKTGAIRSCGCLSLERVAKITYKHGLATHPLYRIWVGIKERCYSKNHTSYSNYGGRGIKMCKEWLEDYFVFYTWAMQNNWVKRLQIDRENNNWNYEPSNCRIVTSKVNARNTRKNNNVEYNGEIKCLSEWAETHGISIKTLRNRLLHGWDFAKAITTPARKHKNYEFSGKYSKNRILEQ